MKLENSLLDKVPQENLSCPKAWLVKNIAVSLFLSLSPVVYPTSLPSGANNDAAVQSVARSTNNHHDISLNDAHESIETQEESVFRRSVSSAMMKYKSLSSIPTKGILIEYPKGYEWKFPKNINFFPKKIEAHETYPYSLIVLGDKMFKVTPSVGEIKDMSLDEETFTTIVKIGIFTKRIKKYKADKPNGEDGLPEYLWKLYHQWESGSYRWSSVQEIPHKDRNKYLFIFQQQK